MAPDGEKTDESESSAGGRLLRWLGERNWKRALVVLAALFVAGALGLASYTVLGALVRDPGNRELVADDLEQLGMQLEGASRPGSAADLDGARGDLVSLADRLRRSESTRPVDILSGMRRVEDIVTRQINDTSDERDLAIGRAKTAESQAERPQPTGGSPALEAAVSAAVADRGARAFLPRTPRSETAAWVVDRLVAESQRDARVIDRATSEARAEHRQAARAARQEAVEATAQARRAEEQQRRLQRIQRDAQRVVEFIGQTPTFTATTSVVSSTLRSGAVRWSFAGLVVVFTLGFLTRAASLAWAETDCSGDTVARLRVRASRLEHLSIIILGATIVALVGGGALVVKVGEFVAVENVEAVAVGKASESKERVTRASVVADQLTRIRDSKAAAERQLEAATNSLDAIDERLEGAGRPEWRRAALLQRGVAQSTVTELERLEAVRREAAERWREADFDTPEETTAEKDIASAEEAIRRLWDRHPELEPALQDLQKQAERERAPLLTQRRQAHQRIRVLDDLEQRVQAQAIASGLGLELLPALADAAPAPETSSRLLPGTSIAPSTRGPTASSVPKVDGASDDRDAKPATGGRAKPGETTGGDMRRSKRSTDDEDAAEDDPGDRGVGQARGRRVRRPRENGDDTESFLSNYTMQVSLARVGIVVFTLFLVQMLLNLQRYITQLAGFYLGRADALELLESGGEAGAFRRKPIGDNDFGEERQLLAAMSPSAIEYGRARPISNRALGLIRDAARAGSKSARR